MFHLHKFETTVTGAPVVYIAKKALLDMWYITNSVNTEVGWFCTVKELPKNNFLIEEVFVPKQRVHSTTTEFTEEGQSEMAVKIMTDDPVNGMDKVNRINSWWHSHCGMAVFASGQDDKQMQEFKTNGKDWYIRGIVNQKGDVKIDVFYYRFFDSSLVFEDVEWHLEDEEVSEDPRKTFWETLVKEYVSGFGVTGNGIRPEGWSDYDGSYIGAYCRGHGSPQTSPPPGYGDVGVREEFVPRPFGRQENIDYTVDG